MPHEKIKVNYRWVNNIGNFYIKNNKKLSGS